MMRKMTIRPASRVNHVNRIGFVLGSRCRIAALHYIGIETARYPGASYYNRAIIYFRKYR